MEKLQPEELATLIAQLNELKMVSLKQQLEQAKYSNLMLSFRLKYGLSEKDSIDSGTGVLKRFVAEENENQNQSSTF